MGIKYYYRVFPWETEDLTVNLSQSAWFYKRITELAKGKWSEEKAEVRLQMAKDRMLQASKKGKDSDDHTRLSVLKTGDVLYIDSHGDYETGELTAEIEEDGASYSSESMTAKVLVGKLVKQGLPENEEILLKLLACHAGGSNDKNIVIPGEVIAQRVAGELARIEGKDFSRIVVSGYPGDTLPMNKPEGRHMLRTGEGNKPIEAKGTPVYFKAGGVKLESKPELFRHAHD